MQKNNVKREKAFLIGVVLRGSSLAQILEQLEEMEFLADTAGADIISKTTQSRNMPDPVTFIGKGKNQTIINQAKDLECKLIIFNDDISKFLRETDLLTTFCIVFGISPSSTDIGILIA